MKVIGVVFNKRNEFGDFYWMIHQEEYSNCLFIFNDNIEHHFTNRLGFGNAIIRKFNKFNTDLEKPMSHGIPTGTLSYGGFTELSNDVKVIIDESIKEINELLIKYKYDTIYFSKDKKEDKLGTSIFNVNEDVIQYITKKIYSLAASTANLSAI
jgi:hypothetical protein